MNRKLSARIASVLLILRGLIEIAGLALPALILLLYAWFGNQTKEIV